jgi:hypothetical protein
VNLAHFKERNSHDAKSNSDEDHRRRNQTQISSSEPFVGPDPIGPEPVGSVRRSDRAIAIEIIEPTPCVRAKAALWLIVERCPDRFAIIV